MEEDLKGTQMVIHITVNLKWVRQMEKVFINGKTEKYMMESGAKG